LRHCGFSHGAVLLLKPFWTGPPHVVQLRSIVIEYFSEEGVFHLQNLDPQCQNTAPSIDAWKENSIAANLLRGPLTT
jgi:hypothetical protein